MQSVPVRFLIGLGYATRLKRLRTTALEPFNEYSPGLATKAQEPFGSVSLVVNYFVILDYAFLVGLYLLLRRKIFFQMANAERKCTFTNEMQEKHSYFRKGWNNHEAECLVCKSGTIYLSCTKVLVI